MNNNSFKNLGGDELPAYRQRMAEQREKAKEFLMALDGKTVDIRTNILPGFTQIEEGIIEFTYSISLNEFEIFEDIQFDDYFYSTTMYCMVDNEYHLFSGFHLNIHTSLGFYDGWMYYAYRNEFILIREHVG